VPAGALRSIMDDFEAKNAGIKVKLISALRGTKQTVVAAAASGRCPMSSASTGVGQRLRQAGSPANVTNHV